MHLIIFSLWHRLIGRTLIGQFLDDLIWSGDIHVPSAEVREVDPSKRFLCKIPRRAALELSSLGVRTRRNSPILLLRHLLLSAYAEAGEMSDLDWRLRTPAGADTEQVLTEFLRAATPPVAIEKLVLSSPRITKTFAERLNTRIDGPGERARRILEWKLGFDIPREDGRLATVFAVIESFRSTLARIGAPDSDADRQALRGTGVNAFVELEGFLDEIVPYIVWILASDHAKVTRFLYTRHIAAGCVPSVLGAAIELGGEVVEWKCSGNTLGTCLRYFQELVKWVESLPQADRDALRRAEGETHAQPSDSVTVFPFRHIELWADANPASLEGLALLLGQAASILNKGDVPGTRNGLEHYREPNRFPTADRILAAVESMQEFVQFSDDMRLFPKLYWLNGTKTDPYGQRSLELVDRRNNRLSIHMPRTVIGTLTMRGLSASRPVLVAPGNILGLPNSDLLFEIRHESAYSAYWESYPARNEDVVLPNLDSENTAQEDADFRPTNR
jgi:hypothetical protein